MFDKIKQEVNKQPSLISPVTNFSRDMPKKMKKKTGSSETESYDFDEIKSKKSLAEES